MNNSIAEKKNGSAAYIVTMFVLNNKALLILIVLMVISNFITHGLFFTYANLSSVSRQVAVSMMLGFGLTVVLSAGEVDLSPGNMVSLIGVIYALTVKGSSFYAALPFALLCGLVFGLINGLITIKFKLVAFIVTLATAQMFKSIAYVLTNAETVAGMPKEVKFLGQGLLFGVIPVSIVLAIIACVVLGVIMYRTKYGTHIVATGGNKEAARVSGINTDWIQISAFVVMGFFCALAAIILTGRVSVAAPGAGEGMEMDAIAAVVIGGTPMNGGKAKVGGTIFGCLVIGVMNNLLNLAGVSSFWQWFAKGCIIIIAVILDAQTSNFLKKRQTA